jgi:hypothetical protein
MVRDLGKTTVDAGEHEIQWDGRNGSGKMAAAGIYFVRLTVAGKESTARLVRLD